MKLTYYGHASFSVELSGKTLLFDPFISPNALAAHIDINSLQADYILVSHGHGDHIADVAAIAQRTGAMVIGGVEVISWLRAKGVENTHEMNFGSYGFDFGRLSFVPAAHSSSMPDGSYGGNPGGFVIASDAGNFYYSGDTSLSTEMQLIPHYARLDFAVLPIGGNYTMDAGDAVVAAQMIQCEKIVGVHYNTFPPISIDTEQAKSLFRMAQKELLLPTIGESLEF
jgi:L-ascorbate metabolism protein UlaG (beta-lactamase superfamily)